MAGPLAIGGHEQAYGLGCGPTGHGCQKRFDFVGLNGKIHARAEEHG